VSIPVASATAPHFLGLNFEGAASYVLLVPLMLQMFKWMIKAAEVCHPTLVGKAKHMHASSGENAYIPE